MPAPTLVKLTTYAELLERCSSRAFETEFDRERGAFTSKLVKGQRYWYFQSTGAEGRTQKYVGRETPELLRRIDRHRESNDDERQRRALVSTLVRSFHVPRPLAEVGDIVAALARAGVFRLRGVLVGTIAYQTYPAMLGTTLPGAALQTGDVDIAQYLNVSVAVEDRTPPMLEVLRGVDATFRAIPPLGKRHSESSYRAANGLRVDFLTPNRGPDTDKPQHLEALQTDAQPLRFLDFLIRDAEPAVLLHGAGVLVLVPAPERYAIHKLIVARRRTTGKAKAEKDLQQAQSLLGALVERKPGELEATWAEAMKRGPSWRQHIGAGLGCISPRVRDAVLRVVGAPRSVIPGLTLSFDVPTPRYDSHRDMVSFEGKAGGATVRCAVSREALEDHFGADDADEAGRVDIFLRHRSKIEHQARKKYLTRPVEEPETVVLGTRDFEKARRAPLRGKRGV